MTDIVIKPSNSGGSVKLQTEGGTNGLTMANTGVLTTSGDVSIGANVAVTGTMTGGTLGSGITFPEGHVIKVTPVIRHSAALQLTDNTITNAAFVNYTCVSSSNKLLLLGVGVLSRGTQNGQGSIYYYLDGTLLSDNQNRDFKDNDEMTIQNHYMDGFSGSKEILLKVQSMSDNSKVVFQPGNGFLIMELQGPLANASTI